MERLIAFIVGGMSSMPRSIQRHQVEHFQRAGPTYGQGVARDLGLTEAKAAA